MKTTFNNIQTSFKQELLDQKHYFDIEILELKKENS